MNAVIDITDLAEQLCDPRQHREERWGWNTSRNKIRLPDHITVQEPLLVQLHQAVTPLLAAPADEGGNNTPRSRPPLQLEALDRYHAITIAAASWADRQRLRVRLTAVANIRLLVGHTTRMDPDHQRLLRADLHRWRNWAATMTGWATIYRPRATCPLADCAEQDTLRINLQAQTAICTACLATWDATTIGLLAEHVTNQRPAHQRITLHSLTQGHGGWATRHPAR